MCLRSYGDTVMAYIVMVYIVTADIVMVYSVMACIVMALRKSGGTPSQQLCLYSHGLCSSGLHSYGLHSYGL